MREEEVLYLYYSDLYFRQIMDFTVTKQINRLCVENESEQYYFKNKLFSLSSVLKDQDGKIVASMKRKSWWNLSFDLAASQQKYNFVSGLNDCVLYLDSTNQEYRTYGAWSFFEKTGGPVTELKRVTSNRIGKYLLKLEMMSIRWL